MVNFAEAKAEVSAATADAIKLAVPLLASAATSLPFGDVVLYLTGSIARHVAAVQGNDELLRKAERQAEEVTQLVQRLAQAQFRENDPSLSNVIEALLPLEGLARSWSAKTPRSKCMSFSLKSGSSTALAFEREFVACTALLDKACETLVLAVSVESFAGIQALREEQAKNAADRRAEFAATSAELALQGQSLEQLQGSVIALEAQSRAEGARVERLLEKLTKDLQASIATEVRKGVAGAALGNAARAAASEGARQTAEELGVNAQALDMHLLDSMQSMLAAVVESEGEATRAAVASSQADMQAAIERGRSGLEAKLDEMQSALVRIEESTLKMSTDGLDPALVALLEEEGVIQNAGFFRRCKVLTLRSLAAVPEADMHELGFSPLVAARIASVMKLDHPSCPLRPGNGATQDAVQPMPPLNLRPVLDLTNLDPFLKEVLENPGKDFGLQQSLDVVLKLVEAGAEQAVKLSGLSTVMVVGVTGEKAIHFCVHECVVLSRIVPA